MRLPFPLKIVLYGLGIEVILLFMVNLGDLRASTVFLPLFSIGFLLYLLALNSAREGREVIGLIVVLGIIFRVTMLFSQPSLSEDIYRYFWDGKVLAHGFNPYSTPPSSPEASFLRGENFEDIGYKATLSAYPPLAQLVFAFSYLLHPQVFTLKLAMVAFDLLTLAILLKLLHLRGINRNNLLIYAWNPLVAIEVASSGHSDAMAVFFVVLCLYFYQKDREFLSGVALGLGVASKLYPLLLLPLFIFKRRWGFTPGFLLPLVLFLPFAGAGANLFSGLMVFMGSAHFNASLFEVLSFFGEVGSRVVVYLSLAGAYIFFRHRDISQGAAGVLGLYLLLAPMVHPWYLLWVLCLLPLVESYSFTLFSGLVTISYLFYGTSHGELVWTESTALKLLEYVPFYALLLVEELYMKRRVLWKN